MKDELRFLIEQQENSIKDADPYTFDAADENGEALEYSKYDDTVSVFPNGDQAVFYTSWADDLRERLGSEIVALFGFEADKNPSSYISTIADGHDFAVLHKRYIVDGRITNGESIHSSGILDIED